MYYHLFLKDELRRPLLYPCLAKCLCLKDSLHEKLTFGERETKYFFLKKNFDNQKKFLYVQKVGGRLPKINIEF